jgi:hypothetical protein
MSTKCHEREFQQPIISLFGDESSGNFIWENQIMFGLDAKLSFPFETHGGPSYTFITGEH